MNCIQCDTSRLNSIVNQLCTVRDISPQFDCESTVYSARQLATFQTLNVVSKTTSSMTLRTIFHRVNHLDWFSDEIFITKYDIYEAGLLYILQMLYIFSIIL